ncbi:uncharacterized protein [Acropora muricata]|uniref:uncharacterized protein isoform X2 n=1 Tax=Acropora muricata TaxID=159855 RepID=UPI0034E3E95B
MADNGQSSSSSSNPKEKKRPTEIDRARIIEQDGEYGYFKNEKFTTVSNFILRCEGVVEEDGDVVGFMLRAKPKNYRNSEADGWLNSVFLTRRDMSDQYTIQNKLDSVRLWISNTKDFLPALLKDMCDEYERRVDCRKMIPVKIFGLQPKSDPPVWVFSKDMQLQLNGEYTIHLKETDSKYAVTGDCCSTYDYRGDIDNGESLRQVISNLETFYGDDISAVLLVLGGTAMAFHYQQLTKLVGGVPPTIAVGDPVSGKSTAVECAMALFNQRECIGAGSEARLLESLVNRTIPLWWDDIDSLVVLEKLTVLLYNKAKKVTMSKDTIGSTVPIISVNYSKLIKGFKKLKMGVEDFGRLFTRMLPIPFGKRTIGKKRIKERLEGKSQLEDLLKDLPKSVSVILKLHNDYAAMTKDVLFNVIQDVVEAMEIDVRSEANFSVLLFSTGKILQHIGLFSSHWEEVIGFFKTQMVPKYKELLVGSFEGIEAVQGSYIAGDADLWEALETLFKDVVSHPDEARKCLKAKYNTKGCSCGEAVAVSLAKALQFSKLKLTSAALTHAIRAKGLGCTGKSMRIDGSSSTCVHISRRLIPQGLLDILDKKGGVDETLLNLNEEEQERTEIDESEDEIVAETSSSAGSDEAVQETVEINESEVNILASASSFAAPSSTEAEYVKLAGKRRKRETESLKDSLTPREVMTKRRPRKEVTYK